MIKKTILSVIAIFCAMVLYAQNDDSEVKTLFSKYNEINGFGAVDLKVTDVASKKAMFAGAYGGVIINKQIMLGVGGYGLATNVEVPDNSDNIDLKGGYGGIILGFIIAPREVIHVTIPLFIGAYDFNNFPRDVNLQTSSFVVAEPGLQVEINVSKTVRFGLGGTYRLIQGTHLSGISDEDLSGFAGNITVKIGRF